MPGQTAKGFPYALPEDKRINWPATSQQLAEKLEAGVIATGSGTYATDGFGVLAIPVPAGLRLMSVTVSQDNDYFAVIRSNNQAGIFNSAGARVGGANVAVRWVAAK